MTGGHISPAGLDIMCLWVYSILVLLVLQSWSDGSLDMAGNSTNSFSITSAHRMLATGNGKEVEEEEDSHKKVDSRVVFSKESLKSDKKV